MHLGRLITAAFLLSPRARRGVALMTVAVIGMCAASVYYLRPWVMWQQPRMAASTTVYPSPETYRDVRYEFLSSALVWALSIDAPGYGNGAGTYRLYRSVDGARTWTKEREGKTAVVWATESSLRFVDAATGFLATDDPLVLRKTSDRGHSWNAVTLPKGRVVQTIQFIDARHGWVTDGAPEAWRLFATDDGGRTWKGPVDVPEDMQLIPEFRDSSEGWAGATAGDRPHVYITTDGGMSWGARDLPVPPDLPGGLRFYSGVRVIPGGGLLCYVSAFTEDTPVRDYAFRSRDGGATWVPMSGSPGDGSYAIGSVFQDSNHWWLEVDSNLFKTSDGGDTWTRLDGVLPPGLSLQRVLDSRHAWGQFYDDPGSNDLGFTSDGGVHWTRLKAPGAR